MKKAQGCLEVEKIANTKRVETLTASAEKSSLNYKDNLAKVTALYKAELTKTVKTHILMRDMADDIQVSSGKYLKLYSSLTLTTSIIKVSVYLINEL